MTEQEEKELKMIYDQLSTIASKKTNHLDGWFSETVDELFCRNTINNLCVNGSWPNVSWDGSKLVFE